MKVEILTKGRRRKRKVRKKNGESFGWEKLTKERK